MEQEGADITQKEPAEEQQKPVAVDNPAVFKGRMCIYADCERVDAANVVDVLNDTLPTFAANSAQISYLWDYYRGVQPVLNRTKDVRPEINNKVVENHAQEIVAFKVGYQLAEPLQYTCRRCRPKAKRRKGIVRRFSTFLFGETEQDDEHLEGIDELNTLMFAEDKASCDRDLFEWMLVAGVGYRMVEADCEADREDGGAPFELLTLDSRRTYVAYSSAYHKRPLLAVWAARDLSTGEELYNVYTEDRFFLVRNGSVVNGAGQPHTYGRIPIVEYRLNNARMGVFEPVLPLLDAINAIESNRLDGIEQTVQSLMKFVNCDIDEETFVGMLKLGAIKVSTVDGSQGDIEILKNDLDQTQTQVTKDDLYQAVVNICGMPNRNGTSGSSSDTGAAVLLRDGWTLAESHAKGYELQFKRAERDMLRLVLAICEQSEDASLDLRIRDIELAFNRRNYENILVKAQVLTTMLKCSKIHPELAFTSCGMFTDPEAAYLASREYMLSQEAQGATQQEPQETEALEGVVGSQATVPEPKEGDNAAQAATA